jgi:enoyl-CoA hydratase
MSVSSIEHIKITTRDTGVAIIQLDRPEKRNAFSQSMIAGLAATLSKLNSDDSVRAVVLTGGPNGPFCG